MSYSQKLQLLIVFTLAILVLSFSAHAGWDMQPGTWIPVCPEIDQPGELFGACSDMSGGMIVGWVETPYTSGAPTYRFRLQRIDADGEPRWGTCGTALDTTATSSLLPSLLVTDGKHGAYVVSAGAGLWRLNRSGEELWRSELRAGSISSAHLTTGGLVYLSSTYNEGVWETHLGKVAESGELLWHLPVPEDARFGLSTNDGSGGSILVFRRENGVYAMSVTSDGIRRWGYDPLVVQEFGSSPTFSASSDAEGNLYVVMCDYAGGVWGQKLGRDGHRLWGSGVRAMHSNGYGGVQAHTAANGDLVAIWIHQSHEWDEPDVIAQRISREGEVLWEADGVWAFTDFGSFAGVAVQDDADHGLWIASKDDPAMPDLFSSPRPVKAQYVDTTGSLAWGEEGLDILNPSPTGKVQLRASGDGAGGLLIALSSPYDTRVSRIGRDKTWGAGRQTGFALQQRMRVSSGIAGFQHGFFDYQTQTVQWSPWQPAVTDSAFDAVRLGWMGVFHYDYETARFAHGIYRLEFPDIVE